MKIDNLQDYDMKNLLWYLNWNNAYGITVFNPYIYRERENYATVSHEVQNTFVLHVVSLIFKFKTPIRPFKMFSILKYIWTSNFIFFRNYFLFFWGLENRSY
jgi:hypothetical protein